MTCAFHSQDTDASHRIKWENFMARHGGGRELTRSTELKHLIRSGVPRMYRTKVWGWMTKTIVGKKYVSAMCVLRGMCVNIACTLDTSE